MKRWLLCAVLAGIFCSTLQAGFVDFGCAFPDSDTGNTHNWIFRGYDEAGNQIGHIQEGDRNGELGTANAYNLAVGEQICELDRDRINFVGATDEDPIFTLQKTIENTTGVTWTSYQLVLEGEATFVKFTASSDKFLNIAYSTDLKTVTYLAPASVADGETVTLNVDINVPTTGLFDFTLTQMPAPEPATIALLAAGSLIFVRKRR